MGKLYEGITPELIAWIGQQHLFFVATAPLYRKQHNARSIDGLPGLDPEQ